MPARLGGSIAVSLSGDPKTVILELEPPTGGLLGKVDMDFIKELTVLGVPADLFMVHEDHGPVAAMTRFVEWCGWKNSRKFVKDHLTERDFIKGVTPVTGFDLR